MVFFQEKANAPAAKPAVSSKSLYKLTNPAVLKLQYQIAQKVWFDHDFHQILPYERLAIWVCMTLPSCNWC